MTHTFDCAICDSHLQLEEKVFKAHYEGHDTCLICRMEKPKEERE